MKVHTTCATCRQTLTLQPADINADSAKATHPDCPAAPPTAADQWFTKLTDHIAKLVKPDHTPTELDEIQLDSLVAKVTEYEQAPPQLGAAAAIYASWGWPVFPLRAVGAPCRFDRADKCKAICQCPKTPATRNGFKDASTDVDRIRAYWTANPAANIGIATGHAFDVIDVDPPDGVKSWRTMVESGVVPDIHGIVQTSRGGYHYLIEPTGDGNSQSILPNVDYRGVGGYVVSPPSWLGAHPHRWRWIVKPSPAIVKQQ